MRTQAGYFFLSGLRVQYTKPPLSINDQLGLLVQRGMLVPDVDQARHYLSHVNYYRLRGYWLPFEDASGAGAHRFRVGTTFDDVVSLYVFDRHLKLLLMDLIERTEVSLRTQWAYQLSMRHGAHAHLVSSLYTSLTVYNKCLASLEEEIKRSHETFIKHYSTKYRQPPSPPLWAVCEVLSLGQLSRWLENLKHRGDRQAIAAIYGLDEKVLCSFLHHLSHVRNLCAHHSRVWNRRFTFTMKIPSRPPALSSGFNPAADRQIYNTFVMLGHLISIVSPGSSWRRDLLALLSGCPHAQPDKMGFPSGWQTLPVWAT